MKRLTAIDFVRGLVMIIMALDHTRDFMHVTAVTQNPTDLNTTTPLLFFTRWITHLCAPTFVFLSGTSVYLSFQNTNNPAESRRFLITRGIWLIIVEFTLVNFALWFDIHFSTFIFDVIAAIGCGFIILGILLNLSPKILGIIGLIIIFCHNLFALIPFGQDSIIKTILTPLFAPNAYQITANTTFVMGYPPIPWLGIMLVGFAAGRFFEFDEAKRKRLFLKIGIVSLILFVIIRAVNIYGDSVPWKFQTDGFYTFLSFINVTKYPPSLLFCLLTLGVTFLILSLVEGMKNKLIDIAVVYGRVPLFYFIVHFYILHLIMFAMVFLQGFSSSDLVFGFNLGRPKAESGVELWAIYLIWIAVVVALYPVCKWFGNYKANHREKTWLRYL